MVRTVHLLEDPERPLREQGTLLQAPSRRQRPCEIAQGLGRDRMLAPERLLANRERLPVGGDRLVGAVEVVESGRDIVDAGRDERMLRAQALPKKGQRLLEKIERLLR